MQARLASPTDARVMIKNGRKRVACRVPCHWRNLAKLIATTAKVMIFWAAFKKDQWLIVTATGGWAKMPWETLWRITSQDEQSSSRPARFGHKLIQRTRVASASAVMAFLICGSLGGGRTGGQADIPAPSLVDIGAHDLRIRVDPDVVPWRAVGKLQAASVNFRVTCTATLVGPSTVLTAAHCVFNRRTHRNFAPASLHFLIGYTATGYGGHAVGVKFSVGNGYDPDQAKETIGSDWALVSLDKTLGGADRILPMLTEPPENGTKVILGGYQQDQPFVLMADPECRIVGRFFDASGRLLLRDNCVGTHGVSGAPLLIYTDGKWQVAAIEVAGDPGVPGGAAVALDDTIKTFAP
jgi:protease YdgD